MLLPDLDSLKAVLQTRGFRITAQRETILQIFQTLPQGHHLSAEDLHILLQQEDERVSLSTIYRTLHLMTRMGVLRELELSKEQKHYELNLPSAELHHHSVCLQCNNTLEFKNDQILQIASNYAQTCGYHVLDCQLTLYVICSEAFEQGTKSKLSKDWRCDRIVES